MALMQLYSFENTQPKKIGQEHGEVFRESVRAMAEIRMELMRREPPYRTQAQVFDLAAQHLPILQQYDLDLFEELIGISEASGLTPEEIVVLNHYTDMRDLGACTQIFMPSSSGNLLGQTWDIHASARPYVLLFKMSPRPTSLGPWIPHQVQNDSEQAQNDITILSAAGCLGLTGYNQNHVGICINNLSSLDARIGLIWPALVRRMLKAKNAVEARDLVLQAPLGSGHHYAVADRQDFFGIETSGTLKKVIAEGCKKPYWHTNHCLDDEIGSVSCIRKGSTTLTRYGAIQKALETDTPDNLDEFWKLFDHVIVKPSSSDVHATATCATFAVNLSTFESKACRGAVSNTIAL